jgi:hypothetical protein
MLGQTTTVLVPFPACLASEFATTLSLGLAFGQARAFAGAPDPGLLALDLLSHGRQRGSIRDGAGCLGESGLETRVAGEAMGERRTARAEARLGRPSAVRLGHGGHGAPGRRAHAFSSRHPVSRVYGARRERVGVWPRLEATRGRSRGTVVAGGSGGMHDLPRERSQSWSLDSVGGATFTSKDVASRN